MKPYAVSLDEMPVAVREFAAYKTGIQNCSQKTVSEYLATIRYDPKRIAVERNGDIVFKSQYDTAILADGDCLEIVSFVGGG